MGHYQGDAEKKRGGVEERGSGGEGEWRRHAD